MKKTKQLLFSAVMVLTSCLLSMPLQAQNKPKTETTPTATVNLPGQLSGDVFIGTDIVNYVKSLSFYAPFTSMPVDGVSGPALTNAINGGNIMQATQYMDGLGRPLQTVSRQGSGSDTDVVSFVVYDEYGRPALQPMPFVANSTGGGFQLNPGADQNTFLNSHYSGEDVFYGKSEFEKSPLNRTLKQMAPGNSWTGNDNGVSNEYLTNTAAENVRRWTMGATPSSASSYPTGELMVMATTDENGNQVREYTNGKGQVVLKKVQKTGTADGHNNWLSTYYVYDIYNNLRVVIPPLAVTRLDTNGWSLSNNDADVFYYYYDGRNRMISKQVPGSGRVDMVYDKLDRVALTQDANQRVINQWTFTKYDALNRPVLTGFITKNLDRTQMQTLANAWTGDKNVKRDALNTAGVLEATSITTSVRDETVDIYRNKNTGFIDYLPGFVSETDAEFNTETVPSLSNEYTFYEGYYDATFPDLSADPFEVNTVNFYDDYDFTAKEWSTDFTSFYSAGTENAVTPLQYNYTQGMATGSKVRILGTDEYLTTVMFYDDRGRVVQTQGDNHLGGADISTTQYDFAGRVLNTYTVHNNPQSTTNTQTRILKRFTYDDAGRLLTIQEKLNDTGSLKTLVANSYNVLGELETKTLGDNLESLDYDYNIRGWLKSINGDYVADSTVGHFFGMDLSYDYGFDENQLNGNIAGVKWRSQSSDKQKAYGFKYDRVNRLTEADYNQLDAPSNWANTVSDFSTDYGYDANGNILNLMRKGTVAGTITAIDNLTYDYGSGFGNASNNNQLLSVQDVAGDLGQGDFKDGTNVGPDYFYDANGNMTRDRNKGINATTGITYNHLNLPETVSFAGNRTITYTYDAAGIKLRKVVNDNWDITITDYAGGFIYEDNKLQHFAHEEGRVRPNKDNKLVYDYFIKDHLGNTRMTLTEETETTIYEATMETAHATFEEGVFLNIAETRNGAEAFEGTQSALLGPESIGPAKMLVVSPGDTVDLSVYAKYPTSFSSTASGNTGSIGSALAALFGNNGGAASVYEQGVYNNLNGNAGSFLASALNTGTSTVPKAYLNYVFFDQDFNLVTAQSGYVQVGAGAKGAFDLISANGLIMEKAGYLYVYLSNEGRTTDGGNVYFDALRVSHKKGHILQEDHYYPFGLSINALSSSAPLSQPNKFKYNGKEFDIDFDLGWYDYGARMYDAQLGRWGVVDPAADVLEMSSPYVYALNSPTIYLDQDGELPIIINGRAACNDCRANSNYWGYQIINTIKNSGVANPGGELHFADGDQYTNYPYTENIEGDYLHGNSPISRRTAGKNQAKEDFQSILSKLARDPESGKIIEKIQIYTHSRGAAFGEGYTKQLLKLIGDYADQFEDPTNVIDFVLNLAPHQSGKTYAVDGVSSFSIDHIGDFLSGNDIEGLKAAFQIDQGHSVFQFLDAHSPGSFVNDVRSFLESFTSEGGTSQQMIDDFVKKLQDEYGIENVTVRQ